MSGCAQPDQECRDPYGGSQMWGAATKNRRFLTAEIWKKRIILEAQTKRDGPQNRRSNSAVFATVYDSIVLHMGLAGLICDAEIAALRCLTCLHLVNICAHPLTVLEDDRSVFPLKLQCRVFTTFPPPSIHISA